MMGDGAMRLIAHLDMDAFYAAIEERDNPRLRGLPIAVGADPKGGEGRGVVSTANYAARAYGIHSAMPISRAWRASEAARQQGKPPVTFLSVNMRKYREVSDRVLALLRRMVPVVEQASIDEAYLDLSHLGSVESAEARCRTIKQAIWEQEQLTGSIGLGLNKLIAKIASGMQKPDGLTVVRKDQVEAFLDPLPIRAIPGIGPKTEVELGRLGIRLVRDLKRYSPGQLHDRFGKRGDDFYDKIRGMDDSPVSEEWEAKSVGEQETFDRDTLDSQVLTDRLNEMCADVVGRLVTEGFATFRTVVLTVRFADFETKSRSHTLVTPAGDPRTLQREALKLLLPFLDKRENPRGKLIRLLGVRVEGLEKAACPTSRLELFSTS
jgi:DNA polymerase IV (DinB-like DNA polymerase)